MPDHINNDPTPGELKVMFLNIMDILREVKENMASKDFVNARFESFNDRLRRAEQDLKSTMTQFEMAKITLDKDSKARDAEIQADIEALKAEVASEMKAAFAELKTVRDVQSNAEIEMRQVRTGRINLVLVAVLGIVGNLVVFFLVGTGK